MAGVLIDLCAFLEQAKGEPWIWGKTDCINWLSPWLKMRLGFDPLETYAARCTSPIRAERIVRAMGGVVAGLDRIFAESGVKRTAAPEVGDVGIVEHFQRGQQIMLSGINCGERWAVRLADGVGMVRRDHVAAWGL